VDEKVLGIKGLQSWVGCLHCVRLPKVAGRFGGTINKGGIVTFWGDREWADEKDTGQMDQTPQKIHVHHFREGHDSKWIFWERRVAYLGHMGSFHKFLGVALSKISIHLYPLLSRNTLCVSGWVLEYLSGEISLMSAAGPLILCDLDSSSFHVYFFLFNMGIISTHFLEFQWE
jgi:hypothetical protein